MELRPGLTFKPQVHNIISNWGGMGDMIARLPAMKYMHDNYKHVSANVYWHDYFLELAEFLLPSTPRLAHWKYSEIPQANTLLPSVNFHPDRLNSLALHLTDVGFLVLLDRMPPGLEYTRYLLSPPAPKPRFLPDKYVVITCGFTAKVREWKPQHINELADKLYGLGYVPVFLGTGKSLPLGEKDKIQANFSEEIDFSKGINLIDQTSLVEALGVIQGAQCVMGVDNGLLHLASCTQTPVVWGFTSVEPHVRLPLSHGPQYVVYPDEAEISCRGCQSRAFYVGHDFRKCMFKDYKCLDYMTADRFIEGLKSVLNESETKQEVCNEITYSPDSVVTHYELCNDGRNLHEGSFGTEVGQLSVVHGDQAPVVK